MLHRVGLTPLLLMPSEFPKILDYGIGLTDLAKYTFGSDTSLRAADFSRGDLFQQLEKYRPRILAFNGKRAAAAFFGRAVPYGYQQAADMGPTRFYVGPSTSGAARRYWDERIWREIAAATI